MAVLGTPNCFTPKEFFLLVMVCFGDSVFLLFECLDVLFFLECVLVWFWFQFFFCRVGGGLVSVNAAITPLQVLFGSSRIGTIFKLKKIRYKRIFFGKRIFLWKRIFFGKGYSLEKDIIINGQEAERMGTRNGIWYLTASKG